ncbi:uncharacterized protein LOC110007739 [Amborella trichopoda]|uniref:Uncharacterized protein n=1 Tax=Amborella trichopoda TaxID=13333 RepID=W1PVR3_AMBTC|nr:uncharacterized protein LOC110007739 [Amborella trichopoda]ERN11385.1 hypothetical protein AMTR_s00176p00051090 [Amborella trichopoda]|eukprot:XP_020526228.1 uncharacterized protein LOC110007739 [Amborella trichopoda]
MQKHRRSFDSIHGTRRISVEKEEQEIVKRSNLISQLLEIERRLQKLQNKSESREEQLKACTEDSGRSSKPESLLSSKSTERSRSRSHELDDTVSSANSGMHQEAYKRMMRHVLKQLEEEAEQWVEVDRTLVLLNQQLHSLREDRDHWQNQAIYNDKKLTKLEDQMLTWRKRAMRSEQRARKLDATNSKLQQVYLELLFCGAHHSSDVETPFQTQLLSRKKIDRPFSSPGVPKATKPIGTLGKENVTKTPSNYSRNGRRVLSDMGNVVGHSL